jgi:hypothetical protein
MQSLPLNFLDTITGPDTATAWIGAIALIVGMALGGLISLFTVGLSERLASERLKREIAHKERATRAGLFAGYLFAGIQMTNLLHEGLEAERRRLANKVGAFDAHRALRPLFESEDWTALNRRGAHILLLVDADAREVIGRFPMDLTTNAVLPDDERLNWDDVSADVQDALRRSLDLT